MTAHKGLEGRVLFHFFFSPVLGLSEGRGRARAELGEVPRIVLLKLCLLEVGGGGEMGLDPT